MIQLEITTRGIPAAIARSARQERRLIDAMYDAAQEGVDVTVEAVRSFTPVMAYNRGGSDRYPGQLRDSVRGDLLISDTSRVSGHVYTDETWAPFVEHGTLEHGPARHMFVLGRRTARPLVTAIFKARMAEALA